jgi:arsenate reductase
VGHRFPVDGLYPKSWNVFAEPDAPEIDFVFTVCDQVVGEACPIWPGRPMAAHWGIKDPLAFAGTDAQQHFAFVQALRYLKMRISAFVALPHESLERKSLAMKLSEISSMEGATDRKGRLDARRMRSVR